MSRVKKSQMYLEQIPKLEKEYSNVISSNFRTLEVFVKISYWHEKTNKFFYQFLNKTKNSKLKQKFDKRPLPDSDYTFMGNLVINRVNLAQANQLHQISSRSSLTSTSSNSSTASASKENQRHSKSNAPLPPPSTMTAVKNVQINNNDDTLSRWMMLSQAKPQSEVTLASVPLFLASHGNFLFSVDQTSYLSIYEKVFTLELKLKNSVKLNMPGIKGFVLL